MDLGVSDLDSLQYIDSEILNELKGIKPIEKKKLLDNVKKLKQ